METAPFPERRMSRLVPVLASLALLPAAPALAQQPADGLPGDLILDTRLRWESVAQDGLQDADAVTLRARLGWRSPERAGLRLLVEAEGVAALADDYNDAVHGPPGQAAVPDPEALELNRLQLEWTGLPGTEVVLGRQRLILDNARFVGNVGFRQNEQTFDALTVRTRAFAPFTLTWAWVDRVHRVLGDDSPQGEWDSDSHLLNAKVPTPLGELVAYGYLLDLEPVPGLSSATWGARLSGTRAVTPEWNATYALEYARQSEHGDNPADFELDYRLVSGGLARGPFAAGLAMERLDGDGVRGFQTPLATLHAFQGWTDVFTTTPPDGLRELALTASWTVRNPALAQGLVLSAAWRDFDAADGGRDYGRELGASARATLNPRWALELKAARFDGDQPAFADRTKVWLALEYRL